MCSFPSLFTAVLWTLSVQIQLLAENWPLEILESPDGREVVDAKDGSLMARGLSVRMGIHIGKPNCEPDPITGRMDYFGPMVNRSSRVQAAANGGQIMVSADVAKLLTEKISLDPAPSTLDGEELEPATAFAIDEIRRIKFKMFSIGERKLKGMEVPEKLTALYPLELAGRHSLENPTDDGKGALISSQVQFSVEQINQFGMLCLRLEALSSSRVFRLPSQRPRTLSANEDEETESHIIYAEPSLLLPALPENSSTAHLMLVLDMLAVRIENSLSNLANKTLQTSCPRL